MARREPDDDDEDTVIQNKEEELVKLKAAKALKKEESPSEGGRLDDAVRNTMGRIANTNMMTIEDGVEHAGDESQVRSQLPPPTHQCPRWHPASLGPDVLGSPYLRWSMLDAAVVSGWGVIVGSSSVSVYTRWETGVGVGVVDLRAGGRWL
ncbi:hypothetical protein V502_07622 [Pseudogymnoascus sp. VKM F-4520 (FW-2644)]|nr:hypothetical protein V502_07622 [Pseudogymnoascus sp. VKM F-4520 (FW-2644)]